MRPNVQVTKIQVLAVIVLCKSFQDGVTWFQSQKQKNNWIGAPAFVYDEESASKCEGAASQVSVGVFKTPAYNASPNYDIELTIGVQNVGGRDLQFVTIDGIIYPCDCIQVLVDVDRLIGLTLTLSYGFTVDVRPQRMVYDVTRNYPFLTGGKVVRCE